MEDSNKPTLQEGITKVLQHMITDNSNAPVVSSRFHSHSAPAMSIGSYVERIVKYTRCSCETLVGALMFLQYHVAFSGHCITIFNVHRTLITAVVIAAKSRDDEYYTNTYYAKIGGITAAELKNLELEFINLLEWDCWLDKDAFDSTVALLIELATTNPSASEISQAVTFWEQKQKEFAFKRRKMVRSAIAMDVESVARRRANNNGGGGSNSSNNNITTNGSHAVGYGTGMGLPVASSPLYGDRQTGMMNAAAPSSSGSLSAVNGGQFGGDHSRGMGSSVGSDHPNYIERLAYGGGSTPLSTNNNNTNNNETTTATNSSHKDPMTSMTPNSSTSNSNLIVTAPCFYPKGMRAPATANASASTSTSSYSRQSGLGPNPYQQQQQHNHYHPASYDSSMMMYNNNNNTNNGRNVNPYSGGGGGGGGRASSQHHNSLYNGGHYSSFPSQPVSQQELNNNRSGSKPPSTPTSANGPSSWAAVAAAGSTPNTATSNAKRGASAQQQQQLLLVPGGGGGNGPSSAKSGSIKSSRTNDTSFATISITNHSATLPPSPTATSPAYVPQGAPGFNTAGSTTTQQLNSNATNNNNNNTATTRVLTKNRFSGSGDSLTGGTPTESSRYSIVGINTNQHPNSYYSYTTESQQKQSNGAKLNNNNTNNNNASPVKNFTEGGGGGRMNGLSRHANSANAMNTGSSDSINGSGGGLANEHTTNTFPSPGIKLSAGDLTAPAAHSHSSEGVGIAANKSSSSALHEEDDESTPFERAGSKRRQTGKKREAPAHWQDDR